LTIERAAARCGLSAHAARGRGGLAQASVELFPHSDEAVAYLLLFGAYSGIVPDGIAELAAADIDWAGDASILLGYVKGRTTRESLNLPKPAVRLLEQWLGHSALLRRFAGRRAPRPVAACRPARLRGVSAGPINRSVIRGWAQRHAVTGDDGRRLKIHRHRIRATHEAMRDTSRWRGNTRALIDPNHSPQVEGGHYLAAATPARREAVEAIIVDAQHDLLRRAHPPAVLPADDAAALARDHPGLIAALDLDEEMVADLVGGRRDVFTAACADQLSGLHGPKGKPCPARPWVCLLCPLAVFAPRHAANLLALKAFFSRQWQQMPAAQLMAVFGPYADRVHQVLDRFDPAVLAEAARRVASRDEELPLRPEELTR
jgi:hypothetical protein